MRRTLQTTALWTTIVWAIAAPAAPSTEPASGYETRPEVQQFIGEMATQHGFDRQVLEALFAQVEQQTSTLRAVTPLPTGKRSWQTYRGNFVNPRRIRGGLEFLDANRDALRRAEAQYGVPAEIIVAIIGVETEYGRNMGSYRVLDALTTLAFDYPRRADYFRGELEQLLLLARESDRSPLSLTGSYAGAIGIPQFMPGSFRRYAVDFDTDGRRDLRDSNADAIGSVAGFLKEHGWVAGAPVATWASADGDAFRALIDGSVLPNCSAAELRAAGLRFDDDIPADAQVVAIELDTPDAAPEYLVGMQNFYVITRYNRSSFYASAVWSLAQAIRTAGSEQRVAR